MKRSWKQEKAYCARRAQELGAEMEAAIERGDRERFKAAYEASARYMTQAQRRRIYIRFLKKVVQA